MAACPCERRSQRARSRHGSIVRGNDCDLSPGISLLARTALYKRGNYYYCNAGPKLLQHMKFGPPPSKSMKTEYSGLECNIDIVNDVDEAIAHIHQFGSSHTDCILHIVTENGESNNYKPWTCE